MNLPAFARTSRRSATIPVVACLALALTATAAFGFGAFRPARHLPVVGGSPYPVAIADLNGDGRNDVAVGSEDDDIVNVLYGKPGGFKPARQYPGGRLSVRDRGEGLQQGRSATTWRSSPRATTRSLC